MRTDSQRFSPATLRLPDYARLHEFNFLPSRYIHTAHASSWLPPHWCSQLADGTLSDRIHAHLSAYLLDRLQIADAWVYGDASLATWLALLPADFLEALIHRAGLRLATRQIRQCVRREDVRQLEAALTKDDWAFIFQDTPTAYPGVPGIEPTLYQFPRETATALGWIALQQVTAGLDRAARVRFDLKLVAPQSLFNRPASEIVLPADLDALFAGLLDDMEPTWDSSNSKTSARTI